MIRRIQWHQPGVPQGVCPTPSLHKRPYIRNYLDSLPAPYSPHRPPQKKKKKKKKKKNTTTGSPPGACRMISRTMVVVYRVTLWCASQNHYPTIHYPTLPHLSNTEGLSPEIIYERPYKLTVHAASCQFFNHKSYSCTLWALIRSSQNVRNNNNNKNNNNNNNNNDNNKQTINVFLVFFS